MNIDHSNHFTKNKENVVTEITYNSLKEFTNAISYKGELYDIFSTEYIFRGMSSSNYELLPNALRKENENSLWMFSGIKKSTDTKINNKWQKFLEYRILKKFYCECDKNRLPLPINYTIRNTIFCNDLIGEEEAICENWLPHDFYEITALAQHYGLPTRLLDWSKNKYIALYFAAIDNLNKKKTDDYIVLWALNFSSAVNMSICPLEIINPAYYNNPNLGAQQGVFTLWKTDKIDFSSKDQHIDRRPLDRLIGEYLSKNPTTLIPNKIFYKIKIPSNESKNLLIYLRQIGYDTARLFPGYLGVVKNMKEIM